MSIHEKLGKVQSELHAPKNQKNTSGNYKYRSAEDILEAVKPVLAAHGLTLVVSDTLVAIGDRVYVRADASVFTADGDSVRAEGWAREAADKKGMDSAQITGATSSYARKYAMNGLFAIDDSKDADATNDHGKASSPKLNSRPSVSKPAASNGLSAADVGAAFQANGVAPDVVKAKLASLGFDGLSKVTDQNVLAELVVWAEGMSA